ncbi:hypothetical protein [Terrimonas pollutisoli]|uniref:hypothetical protein n=1 Tax=Terrimonas pollutisoli TaxID=3034147 RepID=UPI0023EDB26E|nr:hypothetical protein [Terrimonas sp. H1YJ31]
MESALNTRAGVNRVELAILAKWLLHETWLCSMQVLEHRLSAHSITSERKTKLQEMHTAFFYQAFYSPVLTTSDIDHLLQNSRKMLFMLRELDANAWSRFVMENDLSF